MEGDLLHCIIQKKEQEFESWSWQLEEREELPSRTFKHSVDICEKEGPSGTPEARSLKGL